MISSLALNGCWRAHDWAIEVCVIEVWWVRSLNSCNHGSGKYAVSPLEGGWSFVLDAHQTFHWFCIGFGCNFLLFLLLVRRFLKYQTSNPDSSTMPFGSHFGIDFTTFTEMPKVVNSLHRAYRERVFPSKILSFFDSFFITFPCFFRNAFWRAFLAPKTPIYAQNVDLWSPFGFPGCRNGPLNFNL